MINNILKMTVGQAPPPCIDFKDLETQLVQFGNGTQICLMIHEVKLPDGVKDKYNRPLTPYLVFAPMDTKGQPDLSNIVGFMLPCPPVCGDVNTNRGTLSVLLG